MDEKRIDTANEPVDSTDDAGFMDTGVLHPTACGSACDRKHAATEPHNTNLEGQ